MAVTTLAIKRLRGFAAEQRLRLAKPSGDVGSGLTILVGPNSGGKSTVVEAFHAFSKNDVTFSEGKRNTNSKSLVTIRTEYEDGATHELRTVDSGGSETIRDSQRNEPEAWYVLPSRRFFDPYFDRASENRREFLRNSQLPKTRSTPLDRFTLRLFNALENIDRFNEVFGRVMMPVPDWTIDQSDEGRYFIRVNSAGHRHNSDGLGEGVVSLLFIVDALYDSAKNSVIVADEPELSLHPIHQRRLLALFAQYARDRQIVYATHSPYFVDFKHVLNGAEVARVYRRGNASEISQLQRETVDQLEGLTNNLNNPHILGLTARDAFFQDDGLIVVEGQEDVVLSGLLIDQVVKTCGPPYHVEMLKERLFGWGAGGADNIDVILSLLRDLGFERIAAIFDRNKSNLIRELCDKFPKYHFFSIPADDIRTRSCRRSRPPVRGLLDDNRQLRGEFFAETAQLLRSVASYLIDEAPEGSEGAPTGESAP